MLLEALSVDPDAFTRETGWALKPEGACKGEVCVPMPSGASAADGRVDVEVVAEHLGMPLIHDETRQRWALGPESAVTGRTLTSAVAPDLVLPDVDGRDFALSTLRGQKVLLVAWASW
jgi:hypothetical protein